MNDKNFAFNQPDILRPGKENGGGGIERLSEGPSSEIVPHI